MAVSNFSRSSLSRESPVRTRSPTVHLPKRNPKIETRNSKIKIRKSTPLCCTSALCEFRISAFEFRLSIFEFRISIFEFRFSLFDSPPAQSSIGNLLQVLVKPFDGALSDVPLVFGLRDHVTFTRVHHELGFHAEGF